MHELLEKRPEPDWVEQDLLTRDLAAALLDKEIAAQRDALARLSADADARTPAQRRLDSMITVRQSLAAPLNEKVC